MNVILLRGLTREAGHWGSFANALHALGLNIIALDLPGNGRFHQLDSPMSVPAMLSFARLQLGQRSQQTPYLLLGMSLGGMVAAEWAHQHPQEVAGLVLINTSMRPFSSPTERLKPSNWLQLAQMALRWKDVQFVESQIHALTCQQKKQKEIKQKIDVTQWLALRKKAPVSGVNAARQLWAAARYKGQLKPPTAPVLVLSSKQDGLVNPICSERLAKAWQVRHCQHAWAGHDLPHDDEEWVCHQIRAWMQSVEL